MTGEIKELLVVGLLVVVSRREVLQINRVEAL